MGDTVDHGDGDAMMMLNIVVGGKTSKENRQKNKKQSRRERMRSSKKRKRQDQKMKNNAVENSVEKPDEAGNVRKDDANTANDEAIAVRDNEANKAKDNDYDRNDDNFQTKEKNNHKNQEDQSAENATVVALPKKSSSICINSNKFRDNPDKDIIRNDKQFNDDLVLFRSTGSRRKHNDAKHASDAEQNMATSSASSSAAYMATYHARPLEMDRRARASNKIKKSSVSSHIFVDYNGDDVKDGNHLTLREHEASVNQEFEKLSNHTNPTTNGESADPFDQLGVHERLVSAISKNSKGSFQFLRPTVIQCKTSKALLHSASNVFVQSETGSGKTFAYLLPIIHSLAIDRSGAMKKVDRNIGGTRCIVLCPTRELATQTFIAAEKLCSHAFSWLVPGLLVGGEKRKSEKARLRKGITILIATPGRLLDHLGKTECLTTALKGKLEWIVLDEAGKSLIIFNKMIVGKIKGYD